VSVPRGGSLRARRGITHYLAVDGPWPRYARSTDGTFIAYEVSGQGSDDLLLIAPWISHLELYWEIPEAARMFRDLATRTRLIRMDQRGVGLSDRITRVPDLETRMDDLRAVLDEARSRKTLLYGMGLDGGAISSMFAATYPERSSGLILWAGQSRGRWAPDYPWGVPVEDEEAFQDEVARTWGEPETSQHLLAEAGVPSMASDPSSRARWARFFRNAVSRGDAIAHDRAFTDIDYRGILPGIRVPTLVLCKGDSEEAAWTASRIPSASLVRLPEDPDFPPYLGDTDSHLRAVDDFLAELHEADAVLDTVVATVVFTDIVDSTRKAAEVGARAWKQLLEDHHAIVRAFIARFRGQEIDTAGDGFFCTFDGPARAIRCAKAISDRVRRLGIEIRAGVHTGECEVIAGKVGGLGVAIGSRVAALAQPSEVLVTQTVRDLVAGSGLELEPAGEHALKGIPGSWQVFRLAG
jgi:class 3 adenylate cyclase